MLLHINHGLYFRWSYFNAWLCGFYYVLSLWGNVFYGMYGGSGLSPLFQNARVPEALLEPMQRMQSLAMKIIATKVVLRHALMMIVTVSSASTLRLQVCFWKASWVREFVKNDLLG